ncbi:hypothetical protein Taro_035667, partial [Colocasia esculenta]|nr:hypothetical protein [Colocasia esculenta]
GARARVPKGARHGPTAVWSTGVVVSWTPQFLGLCLVERQLDLTSVAARLGGSPVWFVRVSYWCREPVCVTRVWHFPTLAHIPGWICYLFIYVVTVKRQAVRVSRRPHTRRLAPSRVAAEGLHHRQCKSLSVVHLGT